MTEDFPAHHRHTVGVHDHDYGLSFRIHSRASLELDLIALRHQVIVLRRQRPRRLRLFSTDRLFWVCGSIECGAVLDDPRRMPKSAI
jgi:hypothetical protein